MTDEQHNPWTKLSSTDVYQNPWIRVREDKVLTPAGSEGIYGVVSMRNKAIGIIPVDDDGYTYLIGQYRYPLSEYSWEIPMGGGLVEKDLLESAKRELKEETGFTAAKWTSICRLHTSNSVTDEEGFVFLAQELTPGDTAFEETEVLQIKRLPFSEALHMALNNQITDAISVAGILKAAFILGVK
ncbi:MAG TPA: NUDIX hydrolase [Pontibacter sp.]